MVKSGNTFWTINLCFHGKTYPYDLKESFSKVRENGNIIEASIKDFSETLYNSEIFRIKEIIEKILPLAIEEALKTMAEDPERCLFIPEKDHMILSWLEIKDYTAPTNQNLKPSFKLEYALDCYNDYDLVYPYDARGYCYVTYNIDDLENITLLESS